MSTLGNFGNNMILIQRRAEDEVKKKDKEKSKTKGDGINAALVLLKDLRDFQDKVEACSEAQDIADYKKQVEDFNAELDKMYETLLNIARGGMHSNRNKENGGEEIPGVQPENTEQVEQVSHDSNVSGVSAPMSPIAPR